MSNERQPTEPESTPAPLEPGEVALASLRLDLDEGLHFAPGALVVTGRRLLARDPGLSHWRGWPLRAGLSLAASDHAGVGCLELCDGAGRLAVWRHTLGSGRDVQRLVEVFDRRVAGGHEDSSTSTAPGGVCEVCGQALDAGAHDCQPADPDEGPPPSPRALLRLWRFARPYRGRLLAGFFLTLASTAASLVPPYLTMPLMDEVLVPFQQGARIDPGVVSGYLGGLLAAAVLAWGLGWARTYLLALVSERIGADLRAAAFEHLLGLSLQYFGGKRTGDLMARIGADTDRLCLFLSLHLLDFATDVLLIGMTAAILFAIDPGLALVTLLPLPFIAWLIHLVRDRLRHGFEKVDRAWGEVSSVLADTIPGIRVVKAFAQERRETLRFREANRANLAVNDRVNRVWAVFSPTVGMLTETGLLVVWGFGIWQVSRHEITVGVLTAFVAYIGRFYTRLDSMSRIVSLTQKAAAGAKRVFEILDQVSTVPEPSHPLPLSGLGGAIELAGVHFRHGSRAILRGVDLQIPAGELVGLVGASGAGKTTLVNLICRFYDPSDGVIRVDGTDIRAWPVEAYRRHIGLVLQEPYLFYGSVADNVAYGRPDATRAQVVAAARAAHAHPFILRLPLAYDALVGERGQTLSGGERQRVSIARALLIDPRILILDEATSSVDTETEREIQAALDNLVRGRTTIAIAHRLSTLRRADRLVVMEQGRIVEVGRHEALLAQRGAYFRLHQAQQRGARAHEDEPIPVTEAATAPTSPTDAISLHGRLQRDRDGRLRLESVHGGEPLMVMAVRAFPVSAPGEGIALLDGTGAEQAWIDRLDHLPEPEAAMVAGDLASRELLPVISAIEGVSSFATPSTWQVRTDRGNTTLQLRGEEDIRRLPQGGWLIADARGIHFRVGEARSLDRRSLKLLERFL